MGVYGPRTEYPAITNTKPGGYGYTYGQWEQEAETKRGCGSNSHVSVGLTSIFVRLTHNSSWRLRQSL